jgi:hypothetical protein
VFSSTVRLLCGWNINRGNKNECTDFGYEITAVLPVVLLGTAMVTREVAANCSVFGACTTAAHQSQTKASNYKHLKKEALREAVTCAIRRVIWMPTSGLLLLLGLAAVMVRRKR